MRDTSDGAAGASWGSWQLNQSLKEELAFRKQGVGSSATGTQGMGAERLPVEAGVSLGPHEPDLLGEGPHR